MSIFTYQPTNTGMIHEMQFCQRNLQRNNTPWYIINALREFQHFLRSTCADIGVIVRRPYGVLRRIAPHLKMAEPRCWLIACYNSIQLTRIIAPSLAFAVGWCCSPPKCTSPPKTILLFSKISLRFGHENCSSFYEVRFFVLFCQTEAKDKTARQVFEMLSQTFSRVTSSKTSTFAENSWIINA